MASTAEEIDKALQESGFKKSDNDGEYYRSDNGRIEKRYVDSDGWTRSSDNTYPEKHENGNRY